MKGVVVVVAFVLCSGMADGQRELNEDGKPSWQERMYFGGGLGFSGGTNAYYGRYTYIGLYPIIGYMLTNHVSVGTTITYQYYSYPDVNQSVTQYGFSPFVRYNFNQQLFAYTEYMILNSPTYDPNSPRKVYNRMLLGLGFRQPLGARSSINAMALYDVIYNTNDRVFNSPWVFRVFFAF